MISLGTAPPGSWADDDKLEPVLVRAFFGAGVDGLQRCRIPREGLVIGSAARLFDDPFDDARLAARHAEVRLEAGRVLVRDLGSAAGTRLNGLPLIGERVLGAGDVLRLGDTLLLYLPSPRDVAPLDPQADLVGSSAAMVAVRTSIESVATRRHTVVVAGETGTGKEVIARVLHQRSGRTGPFLAVNCGVFTEGLLASDLFGHVRGAFTGAVTEQQGVFRAAKGGTLLLDEVAEIPLALQSNLLRVLEMREVRPVGGTRDIATDVRVIATSNCDLMSLVHSGRFRADLYSRLAQWTIRLPPLRERREDIPGLTTHLLARCDGLGRKLSPDLAEALLLHDWPLNVRGLFTVLSVAVVSSPPEGPLQLGNDVRVALWATRKLTTAVEKVEPTVFNKEDLTSLMERFHGKVAAAARDIGVSRPRLYRLLWAQEIEPEKFRLP